MMEISEYKLLFILPILLLSCCSPKDRISEIETEEVKPEFSKTKGGVNVDLYYSNEDNWPIKFQTIYLAELLPLEGNTEGGFVPALDLLTAPRTKSTENGFVVMSLVQPGKYALAMMGPAGPILLINADDHKEIILEVKAEEITDIGNITVELDPDFIEP